MIENANKRTLDMNRKIKALLISRGIKQTDIAAALKLTKGTVCSTINGHRQSQRVKQYIATLLNKDYIALWGSPTPAKSRKRA
jgi:transcriptional regulator with XRE-family HTH domain